MLSVTLFEIATTILIAGLLYISYSAFDRLYLSPISKFPGPKLAALTYAYEFYYDVYQPGLFIWEIQRLHKIYGPIVRINPHELHCNDPEFYDTIYASSGHRRDVHDFSRRGLDAPMSLGGTVDHDLHRVRREALNPFFSAKNVTQLGPLIQAKIELLCNRLDLQNQDAVVLNNCFMALTVDIIGEFVFGEDYGYLRRPDFGGQWRDDLMDMMKNSKLLNFVVWLVKLMKFMPEWLVMRTAPPAVKDLLQYQKHIRAQVKTVVQKNSSPAENERITVFHALRDSKILPPQEKTVDRLQEEGQVFVAAGSETTAKTLTIIFFHLLDNPMIFNRLRTELESAPGATSWNALQQLPYLSAVISEGLRLDFGITGRNQRTAPQESLKYKQWVLPPGTPISTMSLFMNANESIFPDPWGYNPERWLNANSMQLRKSMVSFGRGARMCIAVNLAHAELFLTIATIIRRFDITLVKGTKADVAFSHDFVVLQPALDSTGVKASFSTR